jgi:hypothetical protein
MHVLITEAVSQRATAYRNDAGRYYVNVYYNYGDGCIHRNTVKDDLTKREAERLANSLNRAAKHLGCGSI